MKIFILEDDPSRMVIFRKMLVDHDITHTDQARKAAFTLKSYKYDFIFLDHDLGGEQMVDSSEENTGYTAAKAIPGSINSNTPIVIHSYNPSGAANMAALLPNAKRVPFGLFDASILKENP